MDKHLKTSLAAARTTPLLKWAGALVMSGAALALGGCGQKGALYMQPAAAVAPAAVASAPAR